MKIIVILSVFLLSFPLLVKADTRNEEILVEDCEVLSVSVSSRVSGDTAFGFGSVSSRSSTLVKCKNGTHIILPAHITVIPKRFSLVKVYSFFGPSIELVERKIKENDQNGKEALSKNFG